MNAMLVQLTVTDLEVLVERAVAKALADHGPERPAACQPLLARSALALALGCSLATIDRMDRDGMPHTIIGRTRRYDLAAVRAWLDTRKMPEAPLPPSPAPAVSLAGVRRLSRRAV